MSPVSRGFRHLRRAVKALEDGSGPGRCTETEGYMTSTYPSARSKRSWPPSTERRVRFRLVRSRGRSIGAAGVEPGVIRAANSIQG